MEISEHQRVLVMAILMLQCFVALLMYMKLTQSASAALFVTMAMSFILWISVTNWNGWYVNLLIADVVFGPIMCFFLCRAKRVEVAYSSSPQPA